MSISGIGSNYSSYNAYQMRKIMTQLSSGNRINSAADDAAGLAIGKNMQKDETILNVTNNNISDSQGLLNVTDGALDSITSNLQRMRELATQASNGIYSNDDKAAMQSEIDQLKQQIDSVSQNTAFNGTNVLDGSSMDLSGANASMNFDSTSAQLGISGFDVTGTFDVSKIDNALEQVSSMRSNIGASYNGMTSNINSNFETSLNTVSARSRIEDADIAKLAMEFKKSSLFQQSNMMTQRQKMGTMQQYVGAIFNMRT